MKVINEGTFNSFCPQTLFLCGTYKENGEPNFGLFCRLTYCSDGGQKILACIGGEKLTKERIRETGVFSANLVTKELLEVADYLGNKEGYDTDKMKNFPLSVSRGTALDVPLLDASPRSFELKVDKSIKLDDSEIFICSIANNWIAEELTDDSVGMADKMKMVTPMLSASQTYFAVGEMLGEWGDWER